MNLTPQRRCPGRAISALASTARRIAFGITPLTVKRRLKLANVSPKLFDLFCREELSLDQLMALAVSDDHEAQERVWGSMSSYERYASNLRRQLIGQQVDAARDPVAIFVGVADYEAAGGVVLRDLFEEGESGGYIGDAELLYRLAKGKLDGHVRELAKEGWAWVEARTSFDYSERHQFAEAPMGMRAPTEKESLKLDALAAVQAEAEAALEALYAGDEDDVDQKAADALETRADKANRETDKLHAKMRRYAPEVLAIAGVVVSIDSSGSVVIYRGLVKPEDRKEAKRLSSVVNSTPTAGSDGSATGSAAPVLSESLQRKLTSHRTKALQVLVAEDAHVALASVVHVLLQQFVIEHAYRCDSALSIRGRSCEGSLAQFADDMEGSKAAVHLKGMLDGWRERIPGDASNLFGWLLGQDDGTLMQLLALCAGLSIDAVTASSKDHPADALAAAVGLDMADWWTATGPSFFAQVSKAQIADAVKEAVSAEAALPLAKLKKIEVVAKVTP